VTESPFVVDLDRKTVAHQGAVLLVCNHDVIGRVDATYDLSAVPEHQFWPTVNVIRGSHRPIRFAVMSKGEVSRHEGYVAAVAEWKSLPWWRRLFTSRPRLY
jgi:hypothetical protein